MTTTVRPARPGDGEGVAIAWIDGGRYLAALNERAFQIPDEDGLVDSTEADLTAERADTIAWLVAEVDGEIAGWISAEIKPPADGARWQIVRELAMSRLTIDALVVAERHRRSGVGEVLMQAVEDWARERGVRVALVDTYHESPQSVPFYEKRMGYRRRAIRFEKDLDGST